MQASGYCLAFARECFAVPSYYASAIDAWNGSKTKHPGDRNPPPAVPLFFLTPSVYDHVVFGGAVGEIITTFNADVRRYTASSTSAAIDAICRDFQGSYLGWTEDINRVTVWTGSTPEPEPIVPTQNGVPIMRLIRIVDDGRIIFVAPGLFQEIPTMDRANALAAVLGPWVEVNVQQGQYIHDQIVDNLNATGGNLSGLGFT
jgi:hypothetical protein